MAEEKKPINYIVQMIEMKDLEDILNGLDGGWKLHSVINHFYQAGKEQVNVILMRGGL